MNGEEDNESSASALFAERKMSGEEDKESSASALFAERKMSCEEGNESSASALFAERKMSGEEGNESSASALFPERKMSGEEDNESSASAVFPERKMSGEEDKESSASALFAERKMSGEEDKESSASALFAERKMSGKEGNKSSASALFAERKMSGEEDKVSSASALFAERKLSGEDDNESSASALFAERKMSGKDDNESSASALFAERKMSGKEDSESSASALFAKRGDIVARVTPEAFQATSEMLKKIREAKSGCSSNEGKRPQTAKRGRKNGGRRRKVSSGLQNIEQNKDAMTKKNIGNSAEGGDDSNYDFEIEPELSDDAKKRLKKLKEDQDKELKEMNEKHEKLFSAIESSMSKEIKPHVPIYANVDNEVVLAISFSQEITRFRCPDSEKFLTIFPRIAQYFNIKPSEVLLSHKEQVITVDDTPKSLNITSADMLECIQYQRKAASEDLGSYHNANFIKISFQASDSKKKMDMFVHKLETMQDIMEKYSELRKITRNLLDFEFDGEKLDDEDTPTSLDMATGNCIDVRVINPNETKKEKPKAESVVITLSSDSEDSDILYSDDSEDSDIIWDD